MIMCAFFQVLLGVDDNDSIQPTKKEMKKECYILLEIFF